MNQTSRTDEPYEGEGLNQSPNAFSNDLVTNQDLNGIANAREQRGRASRSTDNSGQPVAEDVPPSLDEDPDGGAAAQNLTVPIGQIPGRATFHVDGGFSNTAPGNDSIAPRRKKSPLQEIKHTLFTFGKFVGPGFLVAVAYSTCPPYS